MPGWLIFGVGSFIPLMVDKPLGSRNGIDASFSSQKWYMGNGKWEMVQFIWREFNRRCFKGVECLGLMA